MHAAGVPGQLAITADDAVAGHDDGQWVAPIGRTDGTHGPGSMYGAGDVAIRGCFAVRDRRQRLPDRTLKVRASQCKGQVEGSPLSREVVAQLLGCPEAGFLCVLPRRVGLVRVGAFVEVDSREAAGLPPQQLLAKGRVDIAVAGAVNRHGQPFRDVVCDRW